MKKILFLVFMLFSVNLYSQNTGNEKIQYVNSGIFYKLGDFSINKKGNPVLSEVISYNEWMPIPGKNFLFNDQSVVWFKIIVPENNFSNPHIFINRVEQNIEVYNLSNMLYSFGSFKYEKVQSVGMPFHIIKANNGSESLYIRIGSNYGKVGFRMPVIVGEKSDLVIFKIRSTATDVLLAIIYIFIGIVSALAILVIIKNKRLALLFFALSLSIGLFVLSRARILYLFDTSPVVNEYILMMSLYMVPVNVFAFFHYLYGEFFFKLNKRAFQLYLTFAVVALILSLSGIITVDAPLRLFLIFLLIGIVVIIITSIYLAFLKNNEARIVLAGLSLFSVISFFDIFGELMDISVLQQTMQWGFAFLILSFVIIIYRRIMEIQHRLYNYNSDLSDRVDKLNIANERLFLSEQRYKLILESTNDIVFSLSNELIITNVNKSAKRLLFINSDKLIGRKISDLFYSNLDTSNISIQIINLKIDNFLKDKKSFMMRVDLITYANNEPKEFQLFFEYINIENRSEIICRAVSENEDSLVKYLNNENLSFTMPNYINITGDITNRLTRNLGKNLDFKQINIIRIALSEIILNAIEHGNLEIQFSEKTQAMAENTYFSLIQNRQENPDYKNRNIYIDYILKDDKVEYIIADEGKGFDYDDIINRIKIEEIDGLLAHGRGIQMALNIFDEMFYEKNGSKVKLVKYFK